MTRDKLPDQYKWRRGSCACCTSCRIYEEHVNTRLIGRCWWGGPYAGFQRYEDGKYGPVIGREEQERAV